MTATKDTIPRWVVGVIIAFATALATVGAIAITNAATLDEYKSSLGLEIGSNAGVAMGGMST